MARMLGEILKVYNYKRVSPFSFKSTLEALQLLLDPGAFFTVVDLAIRILTNM